ncbi:hypothetical protein I302_103310 [Kwoniella bestiolae CBS 10118]|uniref:Apple domain-containing protein n=1 Tax=Kwoniella bestiolae CBS 10118 TaxID=1296100 RepID=A0A1B9G814_9TREE|nr:hypothetical protein I302_02013 [Kwoniella bestiolae CBS 10118]OCF27175.1 hypothetical protein I302_02013 [Kwoniella bestiolae CBS 10118]
MFFSIQTIALVASTGLLAAQGASAISVEERSTSLCNQPNYGASGYPWKSNSTPGSFCSKNKPSNNRYWKQMPFSDSYDKVKCSGSSRGRYNVCNGGNKKTNLPKKCNPPHKFPWGYKSPTVSSSSAAPAKSSAAASSAAAASPSASGAASSAVASPAASSAAASSAAASPAASSDAAASSAAASSDAATPASAAPSASASAVVDPLSYPVCETTYQVTYQNYTRVAANGVWMGLTMGAAAQDASYMTYTLSTSVDDCLAACDQIEGCVFVNTYYDVNEEENYLPKHTDGVLTCAMFSTCVSTDQNDNWGGQDDPNTIVNSNGYCKSSACGAPA